LDGGVSAGLEAVLAVAWGSEPDEMSPPPTSIPDTERLIESSEKRVIGRCASGTGSDILSRSSSRASTESNEGSLESGESASARPMEEDLGIGTIFESSLFACGLPWPSSGREIECTSVDSFSLESRRSSPAVNSIDRERLGVGGVAFGCAVGRS
jgi:hypothetical protein